MPVTEKITPGGVPSVSEELARSIEGAIEYQESSRGIHIRMVIEGGCSEERYSFQFEASGAGPLTSQMSCRMTGREARARSETLSRDEFVDLLRYADVASRVQAPTLRFDFCPCGDFAQPRHIGVFTIFDCRFQIENLCRSKLRVVRSVEGKTVQALAAVQSHQ